MSLKLKDYKHPYYCSDRNYFDNDCEIEYPSRKDFIAERYDADPDYHLIFRRDINQNEEGLEWSLSLYMVLQRKGIFQSITIGNFSEVDEFEKRIQPYKENLLACRKPIL